MRSPRLLTAASVVVLLAGCLEPGDTPLGPEVVETEIPEGAILYEESDAAVLGLDSFTWDKAIPLFDASMLFCGFDPGTGFRAEPVWCFDPTDGLDEATGGVERAWLQLNFPQQNDSFPQEGDNPDLDSGHRVLVRLWHLAELPDPESPLSSPLNPLALGAFQVPVTDSLLQAPDLEPFALEAAKPYYLPPDTVQAWIDAGEQLALALEWVEGAGVPGMIRIYSRRSEAADDVSTAASLIIEDALGEPSSTKAVSDGMAAGRAASLPPDPGRLTLATGVPRRGHLTLALPDSLRDSRLLVIRATLQLHPDTSALFGMSPDDYSDNLNSYGTPSSEGGLSLHLRAADSADLGSDGLEEGTVLKSALPVWEENLVYYEGTSILHYRSRLREPLSLPLTEWVQDWANGDDANFGLTLMLNGEDERLRQCAWFLADAPADSLLPKLSILYAWRPDLD